MNKENGNGTFRYLKQKGYKLISVPSHARQIYHCNVPPANKETCYLIAHNIEGLTRQKQQVLEPRILQRIYKAEKR
jgi:hypothetical protein